MTTKVEGSSVKRVWLDNSFLAGQPNLTGKSSPKLFCLLHLHHNVGLSLCLFHSSSWALYPRRWKKSFFGSIHKSYFVQYCAIVLQKIRKGKVHFTWPQLSLLFPLSCPCQSFDLVSQVLSKGHYRCLQTISLSPQPFANWGDQQIKTSHSSLSSEMSWERLANVANLQRPEGSFRCLPQNFGIQILSGQLSTPLSHVLQHLMKPSALKLRNNCILDGGLQELFASTPHSNSANLTLINHICVYHAHVLSIFAASASETETPTLCKNLVQFSEHSRSMHQGKCHL